MALLFMDSFDHYATADILEKWTTASGTNAIGAYGRNSTNGLRQTAGTSILYKTVLGGATEVILGVAVNITATNPTTAWICFGSASQWECGLTLQSDLTLRPFVAANGSLVPGGSANFTLIGTSTSQALQSGVWTYIEVKMKCDGSTGSCIVRFNGVEVLNDTGLDTLYSSSALTQFAFGMNVGGPFNYDDLVVMDTTGSLNNALIGDVTVSALFPSGAGTTSGWTPSAGSNYQNVDEASPNDDTDYNSTSVVGTKDTYAMQDCAVGADIRAVQVLASVRKGAEGPGQVKLVVRSGGTDYDGVAQGIGGTSYSFVREVYETDPGSGSPLQAWTESGWNAVEIGIKKTA